MASAHHNTVQHHTDQLVIANGPIKSAHRDPLLNKETFEKSYPSRTRTKSDEDDPLPSDAAKGLFSPRAFFYVILWYIFSAFTLFLNKYILTSTLKGDPTMLSKSLFLFLKGTYSKYFHVI